MGLKRSRSTAIAALLSAALIGGGVAAVAPAVAEDGAQYVATNWKKIWNQKLRPLADKRYYTKVQSDAKYSTKTETGAALGNYYTKAQSDAGYAPKGSSYTKVESDGAYAPKTQSYTKAESDAKYADAKRVLRGSFMILGKDNQHASADISFGPGFSEAPTVRYISLGELVPAGCSGNASAPNAAPGFLCVFESYNFSATSVSMCASIPSAACGIEKADAFGTTLYASAGVPTIQINGTWAARASALAAPTLTGGAAPAPSSGERPEALR